MKRPNPFPYSDSNKRYYTFDYYLRSRFGRKVCKLPLDIGCTCPNIDGRRGTGGCIYCSPRGSGDFAGSPDTSVSDQMAAARAVMERKWGRGIGAIAYFQAHTNTYGDFERLRAKYEEALTVPDTVGISIATRADCITDPMADYLRTLSERTFLTVELGLQSVFDRTAAAIGRGHSYAEFLAGYRKLDGLKICVHLIDGLPGEDRGMMVESARRVGNLHPFEVKLHLLHVLKGTALAGMYERGEIVPMTQEEYVETVCDQLEVLPADTVIGRLTGDGAAADLIAPLWSLKKLTVLNRIDQAMVRRGSMQGAARDG